MGKLYEIRLYKQVSPDYTLDRWDKGGKALFVALVFPQQYWFMKRPTV